MAPKEHHFLIFRHCPRKTSERVRPLGDLPKDVYEYVGADYIPWEELGSHWCLAGSEDIMGNTGQWMMDSGMIKAGAKIQWEIIADDATRDFDTAYYLTAGIRDGLANLKHVESVGQETIKVDRRFSSPIDSAGICKKTYHSDEIRRDIKSRLKHVPRPTLKFSEALKRLQEIGGKGPIGDLSKVLADSEPRLEHDHNNINGAANLLAEAGELLLYTRAGDLDTPFIPEATKQDVFDMIQFQDWLYSVLHVGNIHDATNGAALVQAMLRVLSQGFYESPASPDEDYDTRVTIYVGHDYDLLRLATVLDARWILQEPYISGEDGAFVPAPPMSGVHAVRRFDDEADKTDQIELSFVYHMYAQHAHTQHFVLNSTGILEHSPLIFQKQVESSFVDDEATYIDSQGSKSALQILEDHVLHVLSGYSAGAQQCFHNATKYWTLRDAEKQAASLSTTTTTSSSAPVVPSQSNELASASDPATLVDYTNLMENGILSQDSSQAEAAAFSASDLKLAFGIGALAGILCAYFPWSMLLMFFRRRFAKKVTFKAKLSMAEDTEDSSSASSFCSVSTTDGCDQQKDSEEMDKLLLP